jgi:hypothetical protein
MHPMTHTEISKTINLPEYIDKEIYLLGSILPDFYLFDINRLINLINLKFNLNLKKIEKENKNKNHSKKEILKLLKNTNKEEKEYSLLIGMLSHLIVDKIAHEEMVIKELNKYDNDEQNNHFLLEKYMDLYINKSFSNYKEIYQRLNFKNINIFFKSKISNDSKILNLINYFLWKGFILYKIYIEKKEYKNNNVDFEYYLNKSKSTLKNDLKFYKII